MLFRSRVSVGKRSVICNTNSLMKKIYTMGRDLSKVTDEKKLKKAIEDAFQYDYRLIIEENIIGKEVEVAVFGNGPYEASVAGEIRPRAEFYDVDAKYHSGGNTAIIIRGESRFPLLMMKM